MSADVNHLTNDELASIYDFLNGHITQVQLAKELKRSRTNTYYYIGRAVDYWLKTGVVKFDQVNKPEDLGGIDV
jgi:hypothetical protein